MDKRQQDRNHADLAQVISLLQRLAPWRIPLVRAAARGDIDLIEFERGITRQQVRRSVGQILGSDRPSLILVGDDDYQGIGPAGWAGINVVLRWAEAVVVNGTGGDPSDYERFVAITKTHRRLALIETSSAAAPEWRDAAANCCRRVLALLPQFGVQPVVGPLQ